MVPVCILIDKVASSLCLFLLSSSLVILWQDASTSTSPIITRITKLAEWFLVLHTMQSKMQQSKDGLTWRTGRVPGW